MLCAVQYFSVQRLGSPDLNKLRCLRYSVRAFIFVQSSIGLK